MMKRRSADNPCCSLRTRSFFFKRLLGLILVIVSLAGLLYPLLGEYVNERYQSEVCASYEAEMTKNSCDSDAEGTSSYYISEDGLMGFLEIPSIDVKLGIYEGTSEEQLQMGIGHMKESDPPAGGAGNFCILCAHSGMRSKKMFTDLEKVETGDLILLHSGSSILYYEATKTETLLPEKAAEILDDKVKSEKGDYLALVTCTPYGVNTHRLIVYAKRMEAGKAIKLLSLSSSEYKKRASTWKDMYLKGLKSGGLAILVMGGLIHLIWVYKRQIRRKDCHK